MILQVNKITFKLVHAKLRIGEGGTRPIRLLYYLYILLKLYTAWNNIKIPIITPNLLGYFSEEVLFTNFIN